MDRGEFVKQGFIVDMTSNGGVLVRRQTGLHDGTVMSAHAASFTTPDDFMLWNSQ